MMQLLALLLVLTGVRTMPEVDQKELGRLQGRWVVQQAERQGKKYVFGDSDQRFVLAFKGSKWFLDEQEKSEIVALHPEASPKCMDLKSLEQGNKGQIQEAIYKIDGDNLTICLYQGKGKNRPTRFQTSTADPDTILAVFKRSKKN